MTEGTFETGFDKPREACGVVGLYDSSENAALTAYIALQILQHRGQDAAGMAVWDGEQGNVIIQKGEGLVDEVFRDKGATLGQLSRSPIITGHTKYSTSGGGFETSQPLGSYALAHNGHIEDLATAAYEFDVDMQHAPSDSVGLSMILEKVAGETGDVVKALQIVLPHVEGAYSLVLGQEGNQLIGVRDRHGFRPLSIGQLENGGHILASETAVFDVIGARFIRDVEPGEIVVIDEDGIHSETYDVEIDPKICAFELVYFARPDSNIQGKNTYLARERMGELLAIEHPIDADMVLGVPDSGLPAAKGYARALGIPDESAGGIIKNKYMGRTFINSTQIGRNDKVKLKLNPNRAVVAGKRLVVLDDSIVRGTTTKQLVRMLREAGAKEVHLRIPSPPYAWPCFYGMDTARPEELLAFNRTLQEMTDYVGADSLEYLSNEGLEKAIGLGVGRLCTACTTGIYPTEVPLTLAASRTK